MQDNKESHVIKNRLLSFPPYGKLEVLDPVHREIYETATNQVQFDAKYHIYDSFFEYSRFYITLHSELANILEHPQRAKSSGGSILLKTGGIHYDDYQIYVARPLLASLLDWQLNYLEEYNNEVLICECIQLLRGSLINHSAAWGQIQIGWRKYNFDFILDYANRLPNDQKHSCLINKREELKEQIDFLKTAPEQYINEYIILKQDVKRCDTEIERLTSKNHTNNKIPTSNKELWCSIENSRLFSKQEKADISAYCYDVSQSKSCLLIRLDDLRAQCYNPLLAIFLRSTHFPLVATTGDESIEYVNGQEYASQFVTGFLEGVKHFDDFFKIIPSVLFGSPDYSTSLKRKFEGKKSAFALKCYNLYDNEDWGWYRRAVSITEFWIKGADDVSLIKMIGYYSGLISKVYEIYEKYPSVFGWVENTTDSFWKKMASPYIDRYGSLKVKPPISNMLAVKQDIPESKLATPTEPSLRVETTKNIDQTLTWEGLCKSHVDIVLGLLQTASIIDDKNHLIAKKKQFVVAWTALEKMKFVNLITNKSQLYAILKEQFSSRIGSQQNFSNHLETYRMCLSHTPHSKEKENMLVRLTGVK